jgi:hypothetical protein
MSEKLSAMLPASTGQIEILRGDFLFSGTDGDHTTNFAVLKEALTTAFKLSQDDARQVSRVTPVSAIPAMFKSRVALGLTRFLKYSFRKVK